MIRSKARAKWLAIEQRVQKWLPLFVALSVFISFGAYAKSWQVSQNQIAQQTEAINQANREQAFLADTFCGLVVPLSEIQYQTASGVQVGQESRETAEKLRCQSNLPAFSAGTP